MNPALPTHPDREHETLATPAACPQDCPLCRLRIRRLRQDCCGRRLPLAPPRLDE